MKTTLTALVLATLALVLTGSADAQQKKAAPPAAAQRLKLQTGQTVTGTILDSDPQKKLLVVQADDGRIFEATGNRVLVEENGQTAEEDPRTPRARKGRRVSVTIVVDDNGVSIKITIKRGK